MTLVEQEVVVLLAEAAETKVQTDYWLGGRETEVGWVWASSGAPLLDGSWAGAWMAWLRPGLWRPGRVRGELLRQPASAGCGRGGWRCGQLRLVRGPRGSCR